MATTVDELIDLKDQAVSLAYEAVEGILAVWGENPEGVMGELLGRARAVRERAELYDAAEESEAVSIEDYEENFDQAVIAAKERATCSRCLARTYRSEECVCAGGGDAEDYEEALADERSEDGA